MSYSDVKFTVDCINKYTKENKIDDAFFYDLLMDSGFIKKIRYKDSIGLPWGEWDRASCLLEKLAREIGFLNIDRVVCNMTAKNVVNYAYVFPDFFSDNVDLFFEYLRQISMSDILIILSKVNISKSILKLLLSSDKSIKDIPPYFFLVMLMRGCSLRILPLEKEKSLIASYVKDMLAQDKFFRESLVGKALLYRLKYLSASSSTELEIKTRKALLISGQMRNFIASLSAIKDFLDRTNDLYDVYISTWDSIGDLDIHPSKLHRSVDLEVLEYLSLNNTDVEYFSKKISDVRRNKFGKVDENFINKYLGSVSGSIKINVKDDSDYPYNSMPNPEKMYYHNAYWIRTLGIDFFSKKYSHVLKIRPDMSFTNFDFDIQDDSFLITEEVDGWIFREWGFGIGDQVLYGDVETMMIVLDTHKGCDLADDIVKSIFNKKGQQGHMNIGVCAWLHSINLIRNKNFSHKLLASKKITMQDLISWGVV